MEYRIDFSGNLRVSITESGMRNSKRLCDKHHIYKQCKSTNKGAGILTVQHLRLVHDSSPFTDENNIERNYTTQLVIIRSPEMGGPLKQYMIVSIGAQIWVIELFAERHISLSLQ